MPILVVHKEMLREETLRRSLSGLAELDSIHFCHTYHAAENFITNHIIKNQLPLDMIICQNNIGRLKAVEFYQRITKDKAATYSNGHFYFHTIPVVLIVDPGENADAFTEYGFADVLHDMALENLHLYTDVLASVIKQWRRRFLDDLSNIGILQYEGGHLRYNYGSSEERRIGGYTITLSDAYKKAPTPFQYDWMVASQKQLEIAIGKLDGELRRAARLNTREEHRISALFDKYPFLVKRDNYSTYWHETRLPRGGRQSYRFDITLKPHFNQLADLSVLELKLPNEQFIAGGQFHPTLRSNVIRHISQVNDYKRYVEDDSNHAELIKAFGFIPAKVQYNVLMGRLDDKERHLQTLNRRLEEFNAGHVNLMTYDEFIRFQSRYYERRELLNVF